MTTPIKTIVYYNHQKLLFKFPIKSKISHIQEFLKRNLKIKPTHSVYFFDKFRKALILSNSNISQLAQTQSHFKRESQADCEIVMKFTETF